MSIERKLIGKSHSNTRLDDDIKTRYDHNKYPNLGFRPIKNVEYLLYQPIRGGGFISPLNISILKSKVTYHNFTKCSNIGFRPIKDLSQEIKLLKGGSWYSHPKNCRLENKGEFIANDTDFYVSFRPVRNS